MFCSGTGTAAGSRFGPEQGVYLAVDRARIAERYASGGQGFRGADPLAGLLDDYREFGALVPDGCRHSQPGVEPVQHHIGMAHQHAPPPA